MIHISFFRPLKDEDLMLVPVWYTLIAFGLWASSPIKKAIRRHHPPERGTCLLYNKWPINSKTIRALINIDAALLCSFISL